MILILTNYNNFYHNCYGFYFNIVITARHIIAIMAEYALCFLEAAVIKRMQFETCYFIDT